MRTPEQEIEAYRIALADAIVTKARLVRSSADGLITKQDIRDALERKEQEKAQVVSKTRSDRVKDKKKRGLCTYSGCLDKASRGLFGRVYTLCEYHRDYYKNYQRERVRKRMKGQKI